MHPSSGRCAPLIQAKPIKAKPKPSPIKAFQSSISIMANVSDTDMSSLQASSSSTPGQVPAMTGTQVGKGKGNGGDSDSSEHVVRTAVAKRAPSPYPSRSSTPPTGIRRNRTPSPKPKALALMPAPSYACEVANAAMPMPAGQPVSFTPGVGQSTPEVHLRRHHQELHHQELHVHGVDPQTHSQAIAAAQYAQAKAQAIQREAQVFAQSVQNEAQAYVQGAVSSAQQNASDQAHQYAHQVRSEAERQMLHVAGEAQQHLDVANQTISSLQVRNQELEAQQQQMQQQIAMLQATMQNMIAQQNLQADTSHTHAANITQAAQGPNQNGADVSEALKALAASVGETMKELREIVSPEGSPKFPASTRSAQKASSSSSAAPASLFGLHYEPRLPVFTGVGLSPPGKKKGSASDSPFAVFSTPKPPPRPHPPQPPGQPEVYEIGSNDEEGEEEEDFEPDPEVEVAAVEEGYEESTYHIKDLREQKLPPIPTSAAGYRSWKNSVLTQFASIDKSGEARILRWLQSSLNPNITDRELAALQNNPEGLPRLDAWLAAQVADPKHLKGEFGVSAQAFVERAHAIGVLPSGRALLAMLSKRFRVDRIRGATVSQQTLLAIQLEGFSQQHLQTFRERVEFCLNGFSPDAWPAENTMFSWLYAKLKHCRLLCRSIDKIKDSSQGSVKGTFNWLWTQLIEHLDELREEANEESIRDALVRPKVKGAPASRKKGTTNLNHLSQQILLLPQSPKRKERVPKPRKEKGKVMVKEKGNRKSKESEWEAKGARRR